MVNLRALLNHAREMCATDDGEYPLLPVNPVQRMFKLRKPNPVKPRDRRIPKERIGAVWATLQKRRAEARSVDNRTAADWVCFMLLTGTRLTESGCLKWQHVNFDENTIHLPTDVVKNHNGITLPMSTVLHELLSERKSLPPVAEKVARRRRTHRPSYVFSSWGKAGYIYDARTTMEAVSKIAGLHLSPHDLRRTAEDVAKFCKVDPDERRQLLNHLASDVHGTHYANNPDPRVLAPAVESMHKWIVDQARIAEAMASGANVVPFRPRGEEGHRERDSSAAPPE